MQENVVGIGMMHLRRADFLGHPIPAPPLKTQMGVADYLDSLESGEQGKRPALPEVLAEWMVYRQFAPRTEQFALKFQVTLLFPTLEL
ncbi:MAG: hypothetical protein WCA22_23850 [Candidatus Binatus sp.]